MVQSSKSFACVTAIRSVQSLRIVIDSHIVNKGEESSIIGYCTCEWHKFIDGGSMGVFRLALETWSGALDKRSNLKRRDTARPAADNLSRHSAVIGVG